MRLVDADVADKWMRQNNAFIDAAILKAIPTIDAVPVVRCKECKFYTLLGHCLVHSQEPDQYGPGFIVEMLPDAFCSYGKRREK